MASKPQKSKLLAGLTMDFVRLGELSEEAGDRAKAAGHYFKGGAYRPAARLYAELGDHAKAVESAFRAVLGKKAELDASTTPKHAGELLASAGYHPEAVALFELGKAFEPAAKSALRCGQIERAAGLYGKAGQWTKAATAYLKAGKLREAKRALDWAAQQLQKALAEGPTPSLEKDLRRVERKRAEILGKLGRSAEAADLMRAGGSTVSAAQVLERSGRFAEAIEAYAEVRQFEDALRLASTAPGIDGGTLPRLLGLAGKHEQAAKAYAARGESREAAENFERAEVWDAAADQWMLAREPARRAACFGRLGRHAEAARAYREAGDDIAAADALIVAGNPAGGAALLAKAGHHTRAAEAFLTAERPFEAGEAFQAGGDHARAADAWRQVPARDPRFGQAGIRLAILYFEEGLLDQALERIGLVPIDGMAQDDLACERLYWEARILEGLGRTGDAVARYRHLASVRAEHRDAATRLAALEAQQASVLTSVGGRTAATAPMLSPPPAEGATISPAHTIAASDGGAIRLPEPGEMLTERYRIVGELGRGGMGRVYRADDLELGEPVAIKTLIDIEHGSEDEARLLREVQICRRITHPNIVRVHDIGRFAGGLFVTLELLEGQSFDKVLRRTGRLSRRQTRALLGQVAHGLSEAHALGIVHRDLKPANLFLTAARRVKILDFGIARMDGFDTKLTRTGTAVGSPHYMSPEQLRGEPLDARSDLYALGALAFTLLVGYEPFRGDNLSTIAVGHLQKPPPDPCSIRSDLSTDWGRLITDLLAKRPDERPASAAEVLGRLGSLDVEPEKIS